MEKDKVIDLMTFFTRKNYVVTKRSMSTRVYDNVASFQALQLIWVNVEANKSLVIYDSMSESLNQ